METYATYNSTNTHLSKKKSYCSLCDKNEIVQGETGHINP